MTLRLGLALAERGMLPDAVIRLGIRRLLRDRVRELEGRHAEAGPLEHLSSGPLALATAEANEQHYEVPTAFYQAVLGPQLKYSGCYWPNGVDTLAAAEDAALRQVCERAGLADGQDILELGCGWGSLSLHLAERFPGSRILAVSNSHSQRAFITQRAPANLEVVTADMNVFDTSRRFDRVVSIEMFEHMRNFAALLHHIRGWLRPDGSVFVHIFCHRERAYLFETHGDANWMGRFFFTGGLMPSVGLLSRFDADLQVDEQWTVDGSHYARTAAAWLHNLDRHRRQVRRLFDSTYGDDAAIWYHRWRIFFMACEELFGYRGGTEWLVGHYRLTPRPVGPPLHVQTTPAGADVR